MDIQDELKEAWEEHLGVDGDEFSTALQIFGDDAEARGFGIGYLSAKRRLGVSKPDRRAELLELTKVLDDVANALGRQWLPEDAAHRFEEYLVEFWNAIGRAEKRIATATKQDQRRPREEERMHDSSKRRCTSCDWTGVSEDILTAVSPFDEDDILVGCPQCKDVNTIEVACDEPGCWKSVTCGTPTDDGYRNTCGVHRPPSNVKPREV